LYHLWLFILFTALYLLIQASHTVILLPVIHSIVQLTHIILVMATYI
jgi:hypothetical protein